ncbi:MAG TPA: DUF4258 domain-containing protein [Polyangiaceae bacterium]|nr:DUF4258 domain-containing protein [Polyangiaceae bacterium]HMR75880.1 DUF4258 domain-containing protein [Polyangiaceae bacterium]
MALEDIDVNQQLPPVQARKLLSYVLEHGTVFFSAHAKREIAKDAMTEQDVINVLRAGRIFEPGELERGSWRYRCHTNIFCVVVAFSDVTQSIVVTAWRKK